MFTEDNLCHNLPIKHIISMFEQKIAKNLEEIQLLNCNLPIFSLLYLNIRLFIYVQKDDYVINMAGLWVFFYILINYLGLNNKKVLQKQNIW